jgi:hypothetical protein
MCNIRLVLHYYGVKFEANRWVGIVARLHVWVRDNLGIYRWEDIQKRSGALIGCIAVTWVGREIILEQSILLTHVVFLYGEANQDLCDEATAPQQ